MRRPAIPVLPHAGSNVRCPDKRPLRMSEAECLAGVEIDDSKRDQPGIALILLRHMSANIEK
jgi:hypothetical protein